MLTASIPGHVSVSEDNVVLRRAVRKATIYLIPALMLAFVINYIDRTNIGFAAVSMNRDLGLTNTEFGWGAGVLFFGYCGFEIPSCWALYKVGARIWLARIMISWGIVTALTALTVGPHSFYVFRFLLGIAEAGWSPGTMLFLSFWFPREYRARIVAWFQMSVPLASLISGPVSVSIMKMDGIFGLTGWKWVFVAEGLPAVLIGLVMIFILSNGPEGARWLTLPEKRAIIEAVASETRAKPVSNFWKVFADWRVLMLAAIQFGFTMGSYAVAIWLPLILRGHEVSLSTIGWLAAIPYLCGCISTATWSWYVDRTGRPAWNLATTCLVAAIGLAMSVVFTSLVGELVGICIALIGITAARGVFWSLPPRFLTGVAAAGGLAFINAVGTFGGFVGPLVMGVLRDMTGSFGTGLLVMSAIVLVSSGLTVALHYLAHQD